MPIIRRNRRRSDLQPELDPPDQNSEEPIPDADWFADVPISVPVVVPSAEVVFMGGFAFGAAGIRVALGNIDDASMYGEIGTLYD